jgi:hypothetical protein
MGADAGQMDKTRDASLPRTRCHARRRLDMDGMKRLAAALDIQADGIHHGVGVSDCGLDGVAIVNIGSHEMKARCVLRHVTRRHPDGQAMIEQMLHDAPAQKAGAAEHHNDPIRHGLYPNSVRTGPRRTPRAGPRRNREQPLLAQELPKLCFHPLQSVMYWLKSDQACGKRT